MKRLPISLGAGCDVAIEFLERGIFSEATHFFDYLWNFDGGLRNVTRIIAERFSGWDKEDDYFLSSHPEWNTREEPGRRCVATGDLQRTNVCHWRYQDIALIHWALDSELPRKFRRKAERFLRLLEDDRPLTFVYYRHFHGPLHGSYLGGEDFDVAEKIEELRQETEEFLEVIPGLYPRLDFRLVSCFMVPRRPTEVVAEAIQRSFTKLEDGDRVVYRQVLRRGGPKALKSWDALLEDL